MTSTGPGDDEAPSSGPNALLERFVAGQRAALARVISSVENERPGFRQLLDALYPHIGGAHRIGITGPPGAGKSTLLAELLGLYRARGEAVGVIAVDPTSPFTGGALLGDRIRMSELALDERVFIRSMASRGSFGGLALSTKEVMDVMDAFGFAQLLVETVGVGQSELEIVAAADSTVVVLVPESGDSIQAMKAGLMEAADLFVINKADRPGADRLAREISMMLHLRLGQAYRGRGGRALAPDAGHHGVDLARARRKSGAVPTPASAAAVERASEAAPAPGTEPDGWEIPVLQTVAEDGRGVPELLQALDRHARWLTASGEREARRRTRLRERIREAVDRELRRQVWRERGGESMLDEAVARVQAGASTPYDAAARLLARIVAQPSG